MVLRGAGPCGGAGASRSTVIALVCALLVTPAAASTAVSTARGDSATSFYAQTVLADAPVAYWRLGEPAGETRAVDAAGGGLDGEYRGAVPGAPGALTDDADTAASYPAAATRVDVSAGDQPALDAGERDFTVEAWIRTTRNDDRTIVAKGTGRADTRGWRLAVTDDAGYAGRLRATVYGAAGVATLYGPAQRLDDGDWHHVAAAFDREARVALYVDGAAAIADRPTAWSVNNGSSFRIGDAVGAPHFRGEIDEVAFYDRALGDDRIAAHVEAARSLDAPFVVAAAGDIACDPSSPAFDGGGTPNLCQAPATADVVGLIDPDAVLALGDLQYECGTPSQFAGSYDRSWGRFASRTWPVPGNHEYGSGKPCARSSAEGYFSYFGERAAPDHGGYYATDLGTWRLIALNSNCDAIGGCGPESRQYAWLRGELESTSRRCTIAVWHHPRFASGTHHDDPRMAATWTLLDEHGADIVLAGHAHNYERFAPQDASGDRRDDGIRSFVVGTGGRSLHRVGDGLHANTQAATDDGYGVLRLLLEPAGYAWEFVPVPGFSYQDRGTATCV